MRNSMLFVVYGIAFGWILSRSGAADYNFIQGMFLFTDLQLYGILASGVLFTAIGLQVLRRVGRTASGEPLSITAKPETRGTLVGGMIFGVGWAITGMCPGPIVVNIGEGKLYAIAAFAGMLAGTYLVGLFYQQLSGPLGLPEIHSEA